MAAVAKSIDWEAVETQYRAGVRSLKDIGAEFGVSDAGIIKRARKEDWVRDLSAKIKAKADAKVRASEVSGELAEKRHTNEREVVEANATTQANIRLSQRTDIVRGRNLITKLFAELEAQTDNGELLELLHEIRCDGEKDTNKISELFNKVTSLAGRTDVAKKLSDALKTMITLESQVYGIADGTGDDENTRNVTFNVTAVVHERA